MARRRPRTSRKGTRSTREPGRERARDTAASGAPLQDDPQAQWIAAGLGQPVKALERVVAGPEAGEDAGQVFYVLSLSGMDLAVRQDGLRAYLTNIAPEVAEKEKMTALLRPCRLAKFKLPALKNVRGKKGRKSRVDRAGAWIKVAEGRPPVPGQSAPIEYLHPRQPGQNLAAEELRQLSAAWCDLLQSEIFDEAALQTVRALAVAPGEVLARPLPAIEAQPGQDVFGREIPPPAETRDNHLEAGTRVTRTAAGEYRAERYGYVCRQDNRLSVVSPFWLDTDCLHVYWLVLDTHPPPVTPAMVRQGLADLEVVEGIDEEEIARLAARVREGRQAPGLFLIAAGTLPQPGQDARVEILVDLERRAGQEREDGSIDFREVNFTPNVQAGQRVARRIPPTRGIPGKNLQGHPLPARDGQDQPLRPGDHIRVEPDGEIEQFFATVDGALRLADEVLSVAELLTLRGDVSFSTGNLRFDGEIYINGSVVQGFSVQADGCITIAQTVEPSATVVSGADIIVGGGIVGQKTRVVAQGNLRAHFVQEAAVRAGRDITLGHCAYHADLRAGGQVTVAKGAGNRGGSIVGGQTWAQQGIETHTAGAPGGPETVLVAGVAPEQTRQLDQLKENLDTAHAHILRILRQFDLARVDLVQIRNRIRATRGPRRQILARHAQQLGRLAGVYKRLAARRQRLEQQIGATARQAEIRINDRAFPGTLIRLGEHQRQLDEEVRSPRFHLEDGRLAER